MEANIQNNTENTISTMSAAFDNQNTLMDRVIDKMYNYDLYGRYGDVNQVQDLDLSGILSENTQTQSAMLDALYDDATRLSKTYNYTAEEYYNQALTNERVKNEKDAVEERYNIVIDEILSNQREHEIYRYQYYKQRSQLSILYYFILMIVFFIIITYLNNHFTFVMNNALYAALIGITFAIFFIYTCYKIYDIVLRSEFVFDEYDTSPWANPSDSQNNSADSSSTKCTS